MSARLLAPLLALATALAGCGLKGPLYLPEKSKEVVIRPAPGTPAQPGTVPEAPSPGPAESDGKPAPAPEAPGEPAPPPPGSSNG